MDSGLLSLAMIAQLHQVAVDPGQLQHQFAHEGEACSIDELLRAARRLGFKAKSVTLAEDDIESKILPILASSNDGEYFILARNATYQ
jgi:subfamily B ATP-binding cassette protein HlyB/CyaB